MSSLAALPTQLLTTLMTFLVGFLALPSAGAVVAGASSRVTSGVSAVGAAKVVGASFVACCSGSGFAGAYSYTTSFLGGSGVSSSLVLSLPCWVWAESSPVSFRVKASSGSGWLSPAASAGPAASCVAGVAAGATAGVAAARSASFRVVSFSSVPSLITISLSLSM